LKSLGKNNTHLIKHNFHIV